MSARTDYMEINVQKAEKKMNKKKIPRKKIPKCQSVFAYRMESIFRYRENVIKTIF